MEDRIAVVVDRDLGQRLREEARLDGNRSLSSLIRQILAQHVAETSDVAATRRTAGDAA